MTEKRTFLHRLFARDARWTERWPELVSPPWDGGGASKEEKEEDEESLAKIARRATGAELRRILRSARDNVILIALENPALTHAHVVELCSSTKCGEGVLGAIARRKEWSGDPALALALCLNPKTPYFASRFLLGHLQASDLREIAHSGQVPPQLASDALKQIESKRTRRMGR